MKKTNHYQVNTSSKNIEKFLNDEPYFEPLDEHTIDFNLGTNYESAGMIVNRILNHRDLQDNISLPIT